MKNFESYSPKLEKISSAAKEKAIVFMVAISTLIPQFMSAQENNKFSDVEYSIPEPSMRKSQENLKHAYHLYQKYVEETGDSVVHVQAGSFLEFDFAKYQHGYKLSITKHEELPVPATDSTEAQVSAQVYDLYDVNADGDVEVVESRIIDDANQKIEATSFAETEKQAVNVAYLEGMNLVAYQMKVDMKERKN